MPLAVDLFEDHDAMLGHQTYSYAFDHRLDHALTSGRKTLGRGRMDITRAMHLAWIAGPDRSLQPVLGPGPMPRDRGPEPRPRVVLGDAPGPYGAEDPAAEAGSSPISEYDSCGTNPTSSTGQYDSHALPTTFSTGTGPNT